VQNLQRQAFESFSPDTTILLDISPEDGLGRVASRTGNETRFEQLDISFHQRLRQGFIQLAKQKHYHVIDATLPIEQVQQQIIAAIL